VTEKKFVTETVIVNGQQIAVTKEVMVPVQKKVTIKKSWSAGKGWAHDSNGKELTVKALLERLKAGDTVLLMSNGQALHPAYQKLLSKDAVVLVTNDN
jgi:hypothetical protein